VYCHYRLSLLNYRAIMSEQKWEKIAAAKRATLADSIPKEYRVPKDRQPPDSQLDVTSWPRESGWFSEKELGITESSASHILKQIASKAWSSEEVVKAFCKRAAAAQELVRQGSEHASRKPADPNVDQLPE
jgi:amidase